MRPTTLMILAWAVVAFPAPAISATEACLSDVFRGFDTRLQVDMAGKVPVPDESVGFEIVHGKPVVAFPHRIVAVDGTRLVSQPSLDTIKGLAVDAAGHLWVHTGDLLRRIAPDGLITEGRINGSTRVHNSGARTFLVTSQAGNVTRIAFRSPEGAATEPLAIDGTLRRTAWNKSGLVAVIDDSLVSWTPGTTSVKRMAVDAGLSKVNDIVQVGPDRVVVALPNVVLLITAETRLVVGAIHAQVRWDNDVLYLLDQRSGVIWTLRGMSELGVKSKDLAYAAKLAKAAASSKDDPRRLEAVRIAGCSAVPGSHK